MPTLRFLTAGESHGQGLLIIIEGMVAGLPLSEDYIAAHLSRRQRGYGRGGRMLIEHDRAEMFSGVRQGTTMGSPIGLVIRNRDWVNWQENMSVAPTEERPDPVTRLRPGHTDLTGSLKYNLDDVRPILERASARETASRVAVGAVARRFLEEFGVEIHSHVVCIGGQYAPKDGPIDWQRVEDSPVRCADPDAEAAMIQAIDEARRAGDTVGGIFEVVVTGVPIGLGSHVQWDRKLHARIAEAVMSINAVKGVEMGAGFHAADLRGSQFHDVIEPLDEEVLKGGVPDDLRGLWRRRSNNSGGTEGGISNGQPLVIRAAIKPIATLAHPLPSVDLHSGGLVEAHYERSDVCVVPAGGVIGEAVVAFVLAEAFLEKFGGDHLEETRRNYLSYLKTIGPRALYD